MVDNRPKHLYWSHIEHRTPTTATSVGADPVSGPLTDRDQKIEQSHIRSASIGIDPSQTHPRQVVTGEPLRALLHRDAELIYYSNLLFSDITEDLGATDRVLVVADHSCFVVHMASTPELLESHTQDTGLDIGVCLGENSCGTNPIALAMHHRTPFIMESSEHFCTMFANLRSAAVPVVLPSGKAVAVVQISSGPDSALTINAVLAKLIARELHNLYYMGSISHAHLDSVNATRQSSRIVDNGTLPKLTDRQLEVLQHYANGMSYKQIAKHLNLTSVKTVSEHLDAARRKLSASSRRQAIEKAFELGLFRDPT